MVAEFDMMVCRRVAELLADPGAGDAQDRRQRLRPLARVPRPSPMRCSRCCASSRRSAAACCSSSTETAQVHDLGKVNRVLQELRRRGFQVCLDDFGSGAATFHYLRAFSVDFVKIDGSLVRSHDHRDHAVLRSVVALCQEIKVATIAEMVETTRQARWLARLRVTHGQGYPGSAVAELPAARAAPRRCSTGAAPAALRPAGRPAAASARPAPPRPRRSAAWGRSTRIVQPPSGETRTSSTPPSADSPSACGFSSWRCSRRLRISVRSPHTGRAVSALAVRADQAAAERARGWRRRAGRPAARRGGRAGAPARSQDHTTQLARP